MNDSTSVESKDRNYADILHDLGKPILNIIENISEAASAWHDEALKFADMRLCANMKLFSDIVEAKHAGDFARVQLEHASTLYEHVSKAAVGYSRRLEDILSTGRQENATIHAEKSEAGKRQSAEA